MSATEALPAPSPAQQLGAYIRSIDDDEMRAYAIAYAAAVVEGRGQDFAPAHGWRGPMREAILSIIGHDEPPAQAPKLRVVPDAPEPASGVPGWETCEAHGWVRSPHVHEPAPEQPRIKFGADGWPVAGTCIDCGAGCDRGSWRCAPCNREDIDRYAQAIGAVVNDDGGFHYRKTLAMSRHIPTWDERPFAKDPPFYRALPRLSKAQVQKQLRNLGAKVTTENCEARPPDAILRDPGPDGELRVYRGPGFEYRFLDRR